MRNRFPPLCPFKDGILSLLNKHTLVCDGIQKGALNLFQKCDGAPLLRFIVFGVPLPESPAGGSEFKSQSVGSVTWNFSAL